jgi:hypothetical protein
MAVKHKSVKKSTKRGTGRIRPKKVTVPIEFLIPTPRFDPTKYTGGAARARFMHGGNIFDDMRRGFENFGQQAKGAFEKVGNEFTNPNSVLNQGVAKVGNEFTDSKSDLRKAFYQDGFIRNGLIDGIGKAAAASAFIPGIGEVIAPALGGIASAAKGADQVARMLGAGRRRKFFKVPVSAIRPELYLDYTTEGSKSYRKKRGLKILPKRKSAKRTKSQKYSK